MHHHHGVGSGGPYHQPSPPMQPQYCQQQQPMCGAPYQPMPPQPMYGSGGPYQPPLNGPNSLNDAFSMLTMSEPVLGQAYPPSVPYPSMSEPALGQAYPSPPPGYYSPQQSYQPYPPSSYYPPPATPPPQPYGANFMPFQSEPAGHVAVTPAVPSTLHHSTNDGMHAPSVDSVMLQQFSHMGSNLQSVAVGTVSENQRKYGESVLFATSIPPPYFRQPFYPTLKNRLGSLETFFVDDIGININFNNDSKFCVDAMKKGTNVTHLLPKGKEEALEIVLTQDEGAIRLGTSGGLMSLVKGATDHLVCTITGVLCGQKSSRFERASKHFKDVDRSMTILIYNGTNVAIDLIFATSEHMKTWLHGLCYLVPKSYHPSLARCVTLKKSSMVVFEYKNVISILSEMNFSISSYGEAAFKKLFQECDSSGQGKLTISDFVKLMETLREIPYLTAKFNKVSRNSDKLSKEALLAFVQKNRQNPAYGHDELVQLTRAILQREVDMYTKSDFNRILLSSNNLAWRNTHIYQDMTKPLSHYLMMSSHNTYLEGDQLASYSSVEMYIKTLREGYRCVELDCWDGATEPIIKHGFTLTTEIAMSDVLKAIRDYAFISTPYPLVLSLEVHCSLPFQRMMASQFKEILGDMILLPNKVSQEDLPSPEALRGKILLKGWTAPYYQDSDEDKLDTKQVRSKSDVADELAQLIYLKIVSYSPTLGQPEEIFNFSESFLSSKDARGKAVIIKQTRRQLARVYPKGTRFLSANFDPFLAWNHGCQIAAMNCQTFFRQLWQHDVAFSDNGGCGYILKSPRLLYDDFATNPIVLKVKILGARQLPKATIIPNLIIGPSFRVKVKVIGTPADNKEFSTSPSKNNGFSPDWNINYSFNINAPDMAVLMFYVKDANCKVKQRAYVAFTGSTVTNLLPGYHYLPLKDTNAKAIPGAFLFCKFSIKPLYSGKK